MGNTNKFDTQGSYAGWQGAPMAHPDAMQGPTSGTMADPIGARNDSLFADWKSALESIADLSERLLRADPESWQEAMRAADARRQQAKATG